MIRKTFFLINSLVPKMFWLILYSFYTPIEENILICSYLNFEVFGKDENTSIAIISCIFYCYLKDFYKIIKIKINNYSRTVLLIVINLIYNKYIIFNIKLIYIYDYILLSLKFFNNEYKSYKINNIIIYIYILLRTNILKWYPIFKTYSIFGYYKSTRSNFIDFKNENTKNLKK